MNAGVVQKEINNLEKEIQHVSNIKPQISGVHVLYISQEIEQYVDNAVSYIVSGIEQGDQIFFVENDRLYPMILKKAEKVLTKEQLGNIHFVNNFKFYWQNGDFHPPTILAHFSSIVDPFIEKGISFRTWGHIEWRDEEEFINKLKEFEKKIDERMPETKAISVCAYNEQRLTNPIREMLMECHGFLMTDDKIAPIIK